MMRPIKNIKIFAGIFLLLVGADFAMAEVPHAKTSYEFKIQLYAYLRQTCDTFPHRIDAPANLYRPKATPENSSDPDHFAGKLICENPVNADEFEGIKTFIDGFNFESRRLHAANQMLPEHCFTAEQIRTLAGLLDFEESRLKFLMQAYHHTFDKENFFKVTDVLEFSQSIANLDKYVKNAD